MTPRRALRVLLGLAVTAVFVWLLGRELSRADLASAISRMSPLSLLVALAFLAAGFTARIVRWWWMLRAIEPSVRPGDCGWPFIVSIALNNVLPFRAGDAVRVMGFREHLGVPAMRLLATMLVERLLDLMTLLAIFFIGLRGLSAEAVPPVFVHAALVAAGLAVGATVCLLLGARQLGSVMRWLSRQPVIEGHRLATRLTTAATHLIHSLEVLRSPILALQLMAWSAVAWLLEGGMYATVGHALVGSFGMGAWFSLATGTLATILPSSPGYVGTFDYFAVLGFAAYGAPRETALAFVVIVHLLLWLPVTLIGLAYLLRPGRRSSALSPVQTACVTGGRS